MNLLEETIEVLMRYGKEPKDVKWCGSSEYGWFTWDEFAKVADIEYDNGYGAAKVADDLVIVGEDWWLERHEYDGSEWWEFKTLPAKPKAHRVPKQVIVPDELVGWESLVEIEKVLNKEEVKQKVLDYMREHKKSDITELHKNIGCDIRLLVEIIDELRSEGKIGEG